jgi:hypothetical protein
MFLTFSLASCYASPAIDADGHSYQDLEAHFVFNLDEECALACANRGMKIVSAHGKKQHLRNLHSSRDSITMARCGSAAGAKAATVYMLKGTYRKEGHGDKWLATCGSPPGSTILMSEKGYTLSFSV